MSTLALATHDSIASANDRHREIRIFIEDMRLSTSGDEVQLLLSMNTGSPFDGLNDVRHDITSNPVAGEGVGASNTEIFMAEPRPSSIVDSTMDLIDFGDGSNGEGAQHVERVRRFSDILDALTETIQWGGFGMIALPRSNPGPQGRDAIRLRGCDDSSLRHDCIIGTSPVPQM